MRSAGLRCSLAFDHAPGRGMRLEMARDLGRVRHDAARNRWIIDVRPWGRITSIPMGPESRRLKIRTEELANEILGMIRSDVIKGATVETALAYYLPRPRSTVAVKLANWLERMRDLVDAGERRHLLDVPFAATIERTPRGEGIGDPRGRGPVRGVELDSPEH